MKQIYLLVLCCVLSFSTVTAQLYIDRHSTDPADGWKSCSKKMNPNPEMGEGHWIEFAFDSIHVLSNLKLWNHNDPHHLEDGVSRIEVQYSLDHELWKSAGEFDVKKSQGSSFYEGEDLGTLNDLQAKYVVITALDNHGGKCYGIDEIRIGISEVMTSTTDPELMQAVRIYPQPISDELNIHIELSRAQTVEYQILNSLGQVVQSDSWSTTSGKNRMMIQISAWAAGTYWLKMQIDGKYVQKKFIKL